MAFDAFLKIDGIPGESTDAKHKDEIDLVAFNWGESRASAVNASASGQASGKVSFQDFHFTHKIDKASPSLFLHCANGVHIKEATIHCRKAGRDQQEFLVYKLTEVIVSSYDDSGNVADDTVVETFSLNFAQIEIAFTTQNADGRPGETFTAGWNIRQHKKV